MFAMAITAAIQGSLETASRLVLHFPRVDDRSRPEDADAVLVAFRGLDLDDPEDPTDDFSGVEQFYVHWESLDACGEPTSFLPHIQIDDGDLLLSSGSLSFHVGEGQITGRGIRGAGTIAPGGVEAEFLPCSYALISELGLSRGFDESGGLSMLEVFLAGGEFFGIPSLPGVSPDVDLDGDGIERFETDHGGRIVRCIDGDRTSIEGRACYADERMADGFSLNLRLRALPARFAGREPGWQEELDEICEDPPVESLFDQR
jgi:hypothetical protein